MDDTDRLRILLHLATQEVLDGDGPTVGGVIFWKLSGDVTVMKVRQGENHHTGEDDWPIIASGATALEALNNAILANGLGRQPNNHAQERPDDRR